MDGIARSPQRRRGDASFASCEVMSAKVTAVSEVRTSSTVGARAASASRKAGAIAAGSSIRTPRQPSARAICGVVPIVELGRERPRAVQHPAQRVVVEDDADDRDVVLDRGHQPVHRHRKAAVAAHRDDRPVGMDELGAECRRDRKPHRPRAGRLQKALGALGLIEMRHHDAVFAGVAGDDRILRQAARQLADQPLRQDRLVVGEIGAVVEIAVALAMRGDPALGRCRRCDPRASISCSSWPRITAASPISTCSAG